MERKTLWKAVLVLFAVSVAVSAGELEDGIALYRSERFDEALEFFTRAQSQTPHSSVAAFYLGLTNKQLGNMQEAASHLKDCLAMMPRVDDAYAELIEVLYNMEELDKAEKWIERAERANVDPARISFLKGLVLARRNKPQSAIDAFQKAKTLDPQLAQAAKMQIAIAHAGQRRPKTARRSLEALIEIDPSTDMAFFAEEYKKAIDRSLEEHRTWRFNLGIAYQYDSNVVAKPSETVGVEAVDEITDEDDHALVSTLSVNYSPHIEGRWALLARAALQTISYYDDTDYNVIAPTLSLSPTRSFKRGSFSLPVRHSHTWLGGHEYMALTTVTPTLNLQIVPGHIARIRAGYGRRDMRRYVEGADPAEDRDADIYSLSAGYLYPFAEGKGLINADYEYTREDTEGRNWDSHGHRISAGVLAPIADKLKTSLSASVMFKDYTNRHSVFARPGFPDSPRKRRDTTYRGTAGLIYDINDALGLNVTYSHTRAESNFPIYDHRRNTYRIGLEYKF